MPKIHHECEDCGNAYIVITKEDIDVRFCPHCGEVLNIEEEYEQDDEQL